MDRLANVKKFYEAVGYDSFGASKFLDPSHVSLGHKYVHNYLHPWLWWAIKAEDPDYKPFETPTEAKGTEMVKRYIQEVARDGVALKNAGGGHPAYHIAFEPSQRGCYFDELLKAYCLDDPDWVPDYPNFRNQDLVMAHL